MQKSHVTFYNYDYTILMLHSTTTTSDYTAHNTTLSCDYHATIYYPTIT
jgi:hypothetical protein